MTTEELEAAIVAGFEADDKIINSLWFKDSEVNEDLLQVSANGVQAFTTYRDRFHELEAENARLRGLLAASDDEDDEELKNPPQP